MPLTVTRQADIYLLNDADHVRELRTDLAQVGWEVAAITKPLGTAGTVEVPGETLDCFSVHLPGQQPLTVEGALPTPAHVVVSDKVTVQAMTRAAYNATNPDSPLPDIEGGS
jgi:hypothetical protein